MDFYHQNLRTYSLAQEPTGGAVVEQWQYDFKRDDKNVIPQPPSSQLPEESSIVIDAFVHAIVFNQEEVIEKRLTTWGKQSAEILKKNVNRPDMDGRRPLIVAAEKVRRCAYIYVHIDMHTLLPTTMQV